MKDAHELSRVLLRSMGGVPACNFFCFVVSTHDRKKASGLIRFAAGDPEAEME
jgi:hypothetical protein